jgi:hypothetical protein
VLKFRLFAPVSIGLRAALRWAAPPLAFALAALFLVEQPASADPGVTSPSSASALAAAMNVPPGDIVSASLGTSDANGTGVGDQQLDGFPRAGSTFAVLASGLASSADDPDTNNDECLSCGGTGDDVTGDLAGLNNSQGNDLVQLTLVLRVPSGFGCFATDFAFFSEEFPDYINSSFNDTFIIEVGPPGAASTFSISGNDVIAPNNIAFDTDDSPLTVNSAFGFDPSNPNPNTGTTYDGTSGPLTTRAQVTPGTQIEVVFSVMDLGDSVLDSAAFIDNFRWTTDPPATCKPGAEPVPPPPPVTRTAPYDFQTELNGTIACNFQQTNGTGEAQVQSDVNTGRLQLDMKARALSGAAEGRAAVGVRYTAQATGTLRISANVNVSGFDSLSNVGALKLGEVGIASVKSGVEIFVTKLHPVVQQTSTTDFAARVTTPELLPIPKSPVDIVNYLPAKSYSHSMTIPVNSGDQLFICVGVRSKVVATGLIAYLTTAKALYAAKGKSPAVGTLVKDIRIAYE